MTELAAKDSFRTAGKRGSSSTPVLRLGHEIVLRRGHKTVLRRGHEIVLCRGH